MAKSLVRNRHAVNKLFQLKSQLQAVSLRIAVGWGWRPTAGGWGCMWDDVVNGGQSKSQESRI